MLHLDTPRLRLRSLVPDDAEGPYRTWLRDAEITRFLEVRHAPPDGAALRAYIAGMGATAENLLLGIFLDGGRRHIGNIKLGPIDARYRRADLGLLIGDRTEWGKGYGSEAIDAVSGHAFGALGLKRVGAGCYANNLSSIRAFLKVGFREEGRRPQYYRCGEAWIDLVLLGRLNPAAVAI
ncbi:MAG: GNAT family N-acetyltransferase [Alphaproteobacteria bacterium]|nr:GNAT family N-acetyltransferase [Alphaproteobacteria bacterium]